MSIQAINLTAQLVTFETAHSVVQVLARLDRELNRPDSAQIWTLLSTAKSKDEIVDGIPKIPGSDDFLYLSSTSHDTWLDTFFGITTTPMTYLFTLGNPLITQLVLQHDLRAGLGIPPQILVLENENHKGTKVLYHLPSSLIAIQDTQLREAAVELDQKLEDFVSMITT